MRVLALEPYYGGSHQAFLDGWIARSRHKWTPCTLPAHHWKWRMRHAAVTLADDVAHRAAEGTTWDAIWASDMLDLATFRGLAPAAVARLPAVAYFHENQLTYPVQNPDPRDLHFGFTNFTTALAARQVWFNSAFHRNALLEALRALLRRTPRVEPTDTVARIVDRTRVEPPGVDTFPPRGPRAAGPLRILWAARWEHDKDPDAFFAALRLLAARNVPFRIDVLGESFREVPPVFAQARHELAEQIDRWGFQKRRDEYVAALLEADVFVSTAQHEFFGIGAVEAIAAGAWPLLPRRLAYPELLSVTDGGEDAAAGHFYDGTPEDLATELATLASRVAAGELWPGDPEWGRRLMARFDWGVRAPALDDGLQAAVESSPVAAEN